MEPLRQWICDGCGDVIKRPEHGWLEWLLGQELKSSGFRIVHQAVYSPRQPQGDCYAYNKPPAGKTRYGDNLHKLIGENGEWAMPFLLSFIHKGPYLDSSSRRVESIGEWAEFVRRLTVPYYEEARLYMPTAAQEGLLSEENEVSMFMPATLQRIIKLSSQ